MTHSRTSRRLCLHAKRPAPLLVGGDDCHDVINSPAPLGVFFDVSSTVGLAGGNFLEADIRWDFGDATAGNFSTTGKNKNQASGFVTGHVFEQPGTYQVSASISDVAGARLRTESVTIVVTAFGGESRCLSSAGDFSQAPVGCDLQTSGDLASALSWVTGGSNRRLLLRRGERFSVTESVYLGSTGPTWVGSFGPQSEAPAGIDCNKLQQAVAFGGNDVRLVDLEIAGGGLTLDGENQVALRIDVHDAPFVGLAIGGRQAFLADSQVIGSGYSLFSTPGFQSIDPDDAGFLMLSDTSEAIDAGTAISVGYDYAGNARLTGAGTDIGAFERAAP